MLLPLNSGYRGDILDSEHLLRLRVRMEGGVRGPESPRESQERAAELAGRLETRPSSRLPRRSQEGLGGPSFLAKSCENLRILVSRRHSETFHIKPRAESEACSFLVNLI